jgi:hypothetical protein
MHCDFADRRIQCTEDVLPNASRESNFMCRSRRQQGVMGLVFLLALHSLNAADRYA